MLHRPCIPSRLLPSAYHIDLNSLLNTEIARRSGRAYVFSQLLWDPFAKDAYVKNPDNPLPDPDIWRPARTPLSAYIEAPTSGAPWPDGDPTPRAVSLEWFDQICPPEKQLQLDIAKVNKEMGLNEIGRAHV